MYACVPDIGFKGEDMYACDPMGIYDNLADCVTCINALHNSFGYCIYPVDTAKATRVRVDGGMAGKRYRSGYRIIGSIIYSFDVKQHGPLELHPG